MKINGKNGEYIERVSPQMSAKNPWHLMAWSCHKRENAEKNKDGKPPRCCEEEKMEICWSSLAPTARRHSINGNDMDPRKRKEEKGSSKENLEEHLASRSVREECQLMEWCTTCRQRSARVEKSRRPMLQQERVELSLSHSVIWRHRIITTWYVVYSTPAIYLFCNIYFRCIFLFTFNRTVQELNIEMFSFKRFLWNTDE